MIFGLDYKNDKIHASKAERGQIYQCPNLKCTNRELIIRRGQVRSPHYAHKTRTDCVSEPETEAHLACKLYLQSLLDLDDEFVEYYGMDGARPDVLYNQFAIEIQCSPININEVKRRNRVYEKNGYIPIWIFLEDKFISLKKTKETDEIEKEHRIKKPVIRGSFKGIGWGKYKIFSFKYDNEIIHVYFRDFIGSEFHNDFRKNNELEINSKQDFDAGLEEILSLIKNKIELNDLKKKLNSLPKTIQASLYESTGLDIPHVTAKCFFDINNYKIGMFLNNIFTREKCSMKEFKEYIESLMFNASIKNKSFKDWRKKNTLMRNGNKYIPLCRHEKIHYETPKAYLVYFNRWVPKSCSFRDDKYLYCQEWLYKKTFYNSV